MTQQAIILELLKDGSWVCTSQMYASFIADPRTRIVELKKTGHNLEWRWCESHQHQGQMKEWRLVKKVEMPKRRQSQFLDTYARY